MASNKEMFYHHWCDLTLRTGYREVQEIWEDLQVNWVYHLWVQTFKKPLKKQIYNASKAVKLTANAEKTHFHVSLQKCRTKP